MSEKEKLKNLGLSGDDLVKLYESAELEECSDFEKLEAVHFIAPPAIYYDAKKPVSTLFRYTGTAVEMAFQRPEFWVLILSHTLVSIIYYGFGNEAKGGKPLSPGWPFISGAQLAIPGSLMTFGLVFYLNQTYSRLIQQTQRISIIGGYLGDLVLLLRVHLGDHAGPDARAARHLLCRLVNALHFTIFLSLPQSRELKVDEWALWFMEDDGLLTKQQTERIRKLHTVGTGNWAYKEIVLWLNRGIWAQNSKGIIDNRVASHFTYKLWQLREQADGLYSFASGPVPFAYFHLLNFVLTTYLLLLSYSFTFLAPVWTIPAFFLALTSMIAIRELSNKMSNPLGSDSTDVAMFHFAWNFLSNSSLLINRSLSYPDELEELKPVLNIKAFEKHGHGLGDNFTAAVPLMPQYNGVEQLESLEI